MDRSSIAYLLTETYEVDSYGIQQPTVQRVKIYCNVASVTRSEWFEGGRSGLNPEYRMTMFAPDYSGQKLIEYNGVNYSIYRTYYGRNDTLELYVERRQGNG